MFTQKLASQLQFRVMFTQNQFEIKQQKKKKKILFIKAWFFLQNAKKYPKQNRTA
jgi:hypothetical protein